MIKLTLVMVCAKDGATTRIEPQRPIAVSVANILHITPHQSHGFDGTYLALVGAHAHDLLVAESFDSVYELLHDHP